jgi:hypothetical protein
MLSVTIKPILLNVVMLSVVKLNVVMLSIVMLNVVMLSVVMLNVIMLPFFSLSLKTTRDVFKTLQFLRNLRIGPMRQSVCPWQAVPA